jgi:hypothetical protein
MESTSGISPSFLGLSRSSGQVTHVILTRSRLCPGPKPGSSLHLHVLSTPPAFVLSQDQTLRKKCDVTSNVRHKRVVMSLTTCHRVHRAAAKHDGVINPHPVHDGRGSGSSNEGPGRSLAARCSVFKDHSAGSTGLVASPLRLRSRKRPLAEGPGDAPADFSADLGSSYEAAPFVIRSKSDRGV